MELKRFEFFLVRYVPNVVKKEFVNIGVVLRTLESGGGETMVRFTKDWRRVRCMDPDADLPSFEALESALRRGMAVKEEGTKLVLEEMQDTWSGNFQLTRSDVRYAENYLAGMDDLLEMYVEPNKRESKSRKQARQSIYSSMRTQFERAGVWELMHKRIAAAKYTRPGDPLRIDCGYRPNGTIKMFHAVSLEGDLELAKGLAFSYREIEEGVLKMEGAKLDLAAIVEPRDAWEAKADGKKAGGKLAEGDVDREERYQFAIDTMDAAGIRVLTTKRLEEVATRARQELGI